MNTQTTTWLAVRLERINRTSHTMQRTVACAVVVALLGIIPSKTLRISSFPILEIPDRTHDRRDGVIARGVAVGDDAIRALVAEASAPAPADGSSKYDSLKLRRHDGSPF